MGFLSQFFGANNTAQQDARRVYRAVMEQSRKLEFYGEGRFPDNYDGRIDILTLHIGIIFEVLRTHGEQGNRLAQALFDEMKDDFEVALREEGISDTGVAKRIKPMIRLFYTRVKTYTENFESGEFDKVAAAIHTEDDKVFSEKFGNSLTSYVQQTRATLKEKSLGEIAQIRFAFPQFKD